MGWGERNGIDGEKMIGKDFALSGKTVAFKKNKGGEKLSQFLLPFTMVVI